MRKRIWSILLTVSLLLGLLPTTALAGGDVAMFTIRHDPTAAADEVCTAAGQEMLLPGTHVVSVPDNGWVEIGDDDGNYEVQTTFQEFIANSPDWSISWSVNIGGTSTEVPSGQITSITVDCPALEDGQTAYYVYVNATLTATYQGKPYTVWGSTSLYISDPIWMLLDKDQRQIYTEDRNGEETYHVPLNLPETLIKYTSDNPQGEEVPVSSDFQFSCGSNPACYIDYSGDAPYLSNPDPGRYWITVTIEDQDGNQVATQLQTHYVTDGEVLVRRRLDGNPDVIWTLTKDGTLTFSGKGEVTTTYTPWSTFVTDYRAEKDSNYKITKVVAEEGITSPGTYLLSTWNPNETLELVSLPSTLTELKSNVFRGYQITSATYAGENWSAVTVGDGNDNLNRLLAKKGITLWVEKNRLYGRFTDPGTGDMYNLYRLYFYNSAQASNSDAYISVGLKEPDTTIDLTNLYNHGTLEHFAIYSNGTSPDHEDDALYDVELAKPIRFEQNAFAFPFPNVTASVTESGVSYYPYRVGFSNLTQDYIYELYNPETQYSWKFEGNSVPTNDKVFGACTLTAIYAYEQPDAFLIRNSEAYSLTISEDAQPALPQQQVSWIIPSSVTWTYGQRDTVQNTAYNDTEDGGALTYSSSDESIATVDAEGKATIVGAGTTTITATAAAVPGKYAETSASYTLTINKAPLTITANNASIAYGEVPAHAGWTGSGYAYGEDASVVTGTPVYTYTYEQYQKAGTYNIQVSGLSAQNYDITYVPGTLTVEKATDYTITLGKLEQLAGHVSDVTTQISPWDDTAKFSVEYNVNGKWGSTLPSEVGTYEVRAALTSSDNITPKADNYTYGTLTVQSGSTVSAGDTTVSVGTTVVDGKAEITVTDEQMEAILTNADGDVSMDLSGIKDTDELILPGSLISGLSESESAGNLTVATEDASVTLSAPVLNTVAEAITAGEDTVSLRLAAVTNENLSPKQQEALSSITQKAVIVEVSLVITHADNTTTELHQLGGNVKVNVPYTGAVPEGKYVVVCYLSDDSNVTYLRATYDAATQQISFTTNHFSHYALFVSGKPLVVVNGGSGSGTYAVGDSVTIAADSKSGYRFDKWEVVSGNVSLVNANSAETTFTMPAENVELTAVYTLVNTSSGGGGAAAYSVGTSSTSNGTISVSQKSAAKDATVTITVKPDAGYELDTLTVKDADGKTVKLTKVSDTKYTFKMPASKVTIEAAFTAAETVEPEGPFADVASSAYYYGAVQWAVDNGITNGVTATMFGPDQAVSRAQMVTFLWRAAGSPAASGDSFADVAADTYYADAVTWAVENEITNGMSATSFGPDITVSRAQAVTFLYRGAGISIVQ